ncbi:MAG: glycosyltransferase family 2 protein [Candidatus Anammoximicrobium sp.]|nr:glycosyltransferase family 2 protein [Candidatus Anammoximicrobium sp.]
MNNPAVSTVFSLIIPAYNEVDRLPPYLDSVRGHLMQAFPDSHEVLVVDDGSTDGTRQYVSRMAVQWPALRLVCHASNQGKGAAVRTGMLAAVGELRLFADADGATPIAEESRLRAAIEAGADVVIGSRRLQAPGVVRQRQWFRGVVGWSFARFIRCLLPISVHDTQCGFKMFRRPAAEQLFALSQENGYVFDLELLVLAQRLGYRVAEVGVNWIEMPGSKLHMSREWRKILAGVGRIRRQLRRPA